MSIESWSRSEKAIAHRAFEQARQRERAALVEEVRRRANGMADPSEVWDLHDFLTEQRKAINEKYDFRYSVLLFVFSRLVSEGWLEEAELAGLSEDKRNKIRSLVEMASRY